MRNACDKKRTYVKGQGQGHRKHENHYLSHNFWTGSRRDFRLVSKCSLSKYLCRIPHDAWRSVFASHDVNSEPIDFKIGTHIDFTCTIYHNRGISPIHIGRIPMKLRVWNFFKINTFCLQTTKYTHYIPICLLLKLPSEYILYGILSAIIIYKDVQHKLTTNI